MRVSVSLSSPLLHPPFPSSQANLWFQKVPLDMPWFNRLVVLVMAALGRMRRWHSVLAIGEQWVSLTEGAFNEKVSG